MPADDACLPDEDFTIGIEEEFHVVDASSLALRPRSDRVLPLARARLGDAVRQELNLSQLEVASPVCHTLEEAARSLVALRRSLVDAAAETGSRLLASGTHPFADWLGQAITPKSRYEQIEDQYQQLAREQLVCGCHVHVCVRDPDLAIRVLDRTRPWLPTLLALAANSPFWAGVDTGYASYRTEVFSRFPTTGTPAPLGSRAAYDALVRDLVATGAIDDPSYLYWDVRPSTRYPTLEFRVADACLRVDEAVLVAALCRSLVRTCVDDESAGAPMPSPRPELVQAARWRASRFGLDGDLVDVAGCRVAPAGVVVSRLLERLRRDLEAHDEWTLVRELVDGLLARGSGASRQRAVFAASGSTADVAAMIAEETAGTT